MSISFPFLQRNSIHIQKKNISFLSPMAELCYEDLENQIQRLSIEIQSNIVMESYVDVSNSSIDKIMAMVIIKESTISLTDSQIMMKECENYKVDSVKVNHTGTYVICITKKINGKFTQLSHFTIELHNYSGIVIGSCKLKFQMRE